MGVWASQTTEESGPGEPQGIDGVVGSMNNQVFIIEDGFGWSVGVQPCTS